LFGENELHSRGLEHRKIVVAPGGLAPTRDLGKLLPPETLGGETTRSIARLDEQFRLYVAAYDPEECEDRRLQYIATRELFNVVFAGLRESYRAFIPVSCSWQVGSVVAPFGAALMLVATVRASILDWTEGETATVGPRLPVIHERVYVPSLGEE
jgi:hypothetical protein